MTTLYEINAELEEVLEQMEAYALEHEGDISEFPLSKHLDDLEGKKDKKLLNIGCLIKNLKSDAEALDKEAKALVERKRVKQNRADNLKAYICSVLEPGTKLENARCKVSWRKSESVHLDCEPDALPEKWQKVKIEADKSGIKKALKAGETVQWAKLHEKQNIIIK